MEIEKERERQRFYGFGYCSSEEARVDNPLYKGCCSGQKLMENYGCSPISPLPAEPEAALSHYFPLEPREPLDLLEQFGSLQIDDGRDKSISSDPWEIWSKLGNSGSALTPLGITEQEMSASLIPPTDCHSTPNWLRPCTWQQSSMPSLRDDQYSEPYNFLNEYHRQRIRDIDESPCSRGLGLISEEKRSWSFDEPRRSVLLSNMQSPWSEFSREDSFIIPGKLGYQREQKDGKFKTDPRCIPSVIPRHQSLWEIQGFINLVARDQQGCRFLQHKFDEGTKQEREMIFLEIIDHVSELMVNPFGNYLVQKVLEVCSEDQRREIILVLTRKPSQLVKIALNMHGTRAVQKLIESLKDKNQTSHVISALQPGFLTLIKDPNGNHVIQRCLQHFNYEDSKFIFEAAARHCVEIATHRHGCCVLQRCIAHSTGQLKARLLAEVSVNGLMLAQDAFGNYAVQYVLDLKNDRATEGLKGCFEGRYAQLARQKFSSNVVEKCLCVFDDASKRRIIGELLSVSCFDHILQDPFANYVIQSALLNSKGQSRNSLVEAIRAHEGVLKTSPYCKRIFTLLNKKNPEHYKIALQHR